MRASILLIIVIFSGCMFNNRNLNNIVVKGNEAVIAKSENYILDDPMNYNKIADFNEKILKAYKRTILSAISSDFKTGFVYKIIPEGIINPFSEIEVECLVQNKYSGKYGEKLCGKFFKNIEEEFNH